MNHPSDGRKYIHSVGKVLIKMGYQFKRSALNPGSSGETLFLLLLSLSNIN